MNNLKRKGYVVAEQHGLTYHFVPKIEQSKYKADFMKGFVDKYFKSSSVNGFLFAKEDNISPEELKDIINEIEKGKEV